MIPPTLIDSRIVEEFPIAGYRGILHTDLKVDYAADVEFAHILAIHPEDPELDAVLLVTSEVNATAGTLGEGSHFLCVFYGSQHSNHGSSDDYADLDNFKAASLELWEELGADLLNTDACSNCGELQWEEVRLCERCEKGGCDNCISSRPPELLDRLSFVGTEPPMCESCRTEFRDRRFKLVMMFYTPLVIIALGYLAYTSL